ncbi:MAG: hypothetical protein ACE5GS_08690 [Kiloniellaceae bacterium]
MTATLRTLVLALSLAVAAAAAAAERVVVRVGEHPGFSRLVFDWARPVGVRLDRESGRARLVFDRSGELDLARFRADPPPDVTDIAAEAGPKGLSVVVAVAPGSKLRLLESDRSVVLDVLKPDTALDAPAAKPNDRRRRRPAGRGEPEQSGEAAGFTPPAPVPERKPEVPAAAETPPPPPAGRAPEAGSGAPIPLLPGQATAAGRPGAGGQGPTAAPAEHGLRAENAPRPKPKPNRAGATRATGAEKAGPREAAAQKEANKAKGGKGGRRARVGGVLVVADPAPVLIDTAPSPARASLHPASRELRFEWGDGVAAAVFRYGAHLWLVFDRPPPGDLARAIARLAPEVAPVEQYVVSGATLIRLTAPPILEPRVTRDGSAWVVDLWPSGRRPTPAIELEIDARDKPAQVLFRMQGPERTLSFPEPGSGTPIIIVPARGENQGLDTAQTFPQFRALRSVQGLVLAPRSDGLEVTVAGNGVWVRHPDGLILSHGGTLALLKSNVPAPPKGPRLFALERWRRGGFENLTAIRRALQSALAQAEPARIAEARLDLARFYFAHGFAAESVGVLRLGEVFDPRLGLDPEVRLMRGVGAFLSENYVAAAADLFHPSMIGEWEAELWHAAMAAAARDWPVAADMFAQSEELIGAYPHRVRTRLRLLAAEARLGIEDAEGAKRYLDQARSDEPSVDEEAQIAFLVGRRLQVRGDDDAAKALWQKVANLTAHRPSRARARLALLDLALAHDEVTPGQAIEELERLRFAWRGDHFEIMLLERLGELYVAQGQYRQGLEAFRRAASYFPTSRPAQVVAQRMREVFLDLYLGPLSEALPPLSALALYEEFKELTPPGATGDQVIARLAERLVEVDLLPRAAQLLTTQVKYRLSGPAKARMGGRLASIHLLDHAPAKALEALDMSDERDMAEDLRRARGYLRSRALSRLGRHDEALALLGDDDGPEALRLRADILWAQGDWPAAARVLARLVPARAPTDRPLTEAESRNVIDLAVALTMGGERARLIELNQAYWPAMAVGPDRETFALLARGLEAGRAKSIAEELAEVDQVEEFMADYRKRLQQANLDRPN